MSLPSSYSRVITACPRFELEVISLTVSRPSSSRSIGSVIAASTSSAEAPVHFTVTVMNSMSNVGKNCVLSRVRDHAPASSMIAISRLHATGWPANTAMRPAERSGAGGALAEGVVMVEPGPAVRAGFVAARRLGSDAGARVIRAAARRP